MDGQQPQLNQKLGVWRTWECPKGLISLLIYAKILVVNFRSRWTWTKTMIFKKKLNDCFLSWKHRTKLSFSIWMMLLRKDTLLIPSETNHHLQIGKNTSQVITTTTNISLAFPWNLEHGMIFQENITHGLKTFTQFAKFCVKSYNYYKQHAQLKHSVWSQ